MIKIKFKKLNENAQLPTKGSEYAGAFDVYAAEITKESDQYCIVKLGFATEIPHGYAMKVSPRSSLTKENWYIPNTPCLIDSDYRGEWQIRFRGVPIGVKSIGAKNIKNGKYGVDLELVYSEFPFQIGDRVGQIYLEKVIPIEFREVKELDDTTRGSGGFGSTGK